MDKKSNHSSRQGLNKANQSELSRKSSDVFSSKQWPHNGRRRENTYQSNSKQDPNRKSLSTKSRPNADKRPRIRGLGGSVCGLSAAYNMSATSTRLANDEDVSCVDSEAFASDDLLEVETGSIYSRRSKKQNLNHLLNFNYVPHDQENALAGTSGVFHKNSNKNRGVNARRQKYNKEQFLQANFQFVLKSEKNIQQNIASPDALVDWNLIEQINIQTTEEQQCPICLYPPVAAKLTRCGHVYCWPCILHYLALSDKTWRKCPICYDAVHIDDLKSTTIFQLTNWNVCGTITMQLMRRQKGSLFIEQGEGIFKIPHLRDNNDIIKFTKFLLADSDEIQSIIDRERQELQFAKVEDSPESIFANQALDILQQRENNLKREFVIQNASDIKTDLISQEIMEMSQQLGAVNLDDLQSCSSSDIDNSEKLGANDDAKYYYFYQSSDGQHIYLHSLNVRILQAMYGSLTKCPGLIKGKILEKHSYSMDEDLRRKLRYLEHLPLTCQFEVVELELDEPVVLPEILNSFKDDIISRQKQRMKRAREESKRERQINEMNERQMGKIISRLANIDIKSPRQFPSCGSDEFQLADSVCDFPQSLGFDLSSSPLIERKTSNSTSFADMVSTSKRESWPTLGTSLPENQSGNTDAWRNANSAVRYHEVAHQSGRVFESDNLETIFESLDQQNLGDVIVQALEQKKSVVCECKDDLCAKGNTGSEGRKKKKNKKMLLFSTGMNHKGN